MIYLTLSTETDKIKYNRTLFKSNFFEQYLYLYKFIKLKMYYSSLMFEGSGYLKL